VKLRRHLASALFAGHISELQPWLADQRTNADALAFEKLEEA